MSEQQVAPTYGRTYRAMGAHRRVGQNRALCSDQLRLTLEAFTREQVERSSYLHLCRRCEAKAHKLTKNDE